VAQPAVGIIGLGIMGSAMSFSLLRAGFPVIGYDIAAQRRAEHARSGGTEAKSVRDVARTAEVIVTSLPSARALEDVAQELSVSARRGQIVIETSTMPIPAKEAARDKIERSGAVLLDCPLSGTGAQARAKDLIVYASGERSACERAAPIMDGFARAHYYIGAFGNGSKMKFVANLLVAIHNVAAAEAMVLGMKAGLDPALVLKVVGDGAGSSRMLQVRGPMMVKGDYSEATMKVEVWQKDMTIIGDFVRELDCPAPLFAASAPIYNAAMAMGLAKEDTGAVCAVLEEMAGSPRRARRNAKKPKKS
jgi:3-hydroxyisobutyrate dehydrogenase-like beta-hydroxyacid dehydrogenase